MTGYYNISCDPGVNTGIAVWDRYGDLVKTLTVHTPRGMGPKRKDGSRKALSETQRIITLGERLDEVFLDLYESAPSDFTPIFMVRIETFGNHNSRFGANRMNLCSQSRAILAWIASRYAVDVDGISKGKAPKSDADWLAKKYGIGMEESKEHERDALHLGILCNFDKPQRSKR